MTEDTQQRDSITVFPSADADWFPLIFNSSALKAHFKENFWSICFSFLTVHYRLCPFIAFLLGFFFVSKNPNLNAFVWIFRPLAAASLPSAAL